MPAKPLTSSFLWLWTSVRKWDEQIRAHEIHHIKHVIYVTKAIRLSDDELNFVVRSFNFGVAKTQLDSIQDVLLVPFHLFVKIMHSGDSTVACPPKPAFQRLCSLLFGGALKK